MRRADRCTSAGSQDTTWLTELGLVPTQTVTAADFLTSCLARVPTCVRYDYASQQALLPNILTVASVLGAVPVDPTMGVTCGATAFDATVAFASRNTPALATSYVFDTYGSQTTGLAMLDPGYDPAPSDPAHPAITRDMSPALVDFVFSQRLFVAFLVNGCVSGNPEQTVLSTLVNAGVWPTPLGVYGYNDSWNVLGGDLYEAQTTCLGSRNMGAIASMTGNLSFFSTRSPPITESNVVTPNVPEPVRYDPTQTYVAFVVGDGDNIGYILGGRHDWFRQRLDACGSSSTPCPPLSWTISPHLTQLAPDVLRWYYDQSHATGQDYFVLPPSGHLYAYPSSMPDDVQDRFVAATETDACILGVTGTVHWDFAGTWHTAEDVFLPKYADGPVHGLFTVNVPYLVQPFTWWPANQFYEIRTGTRGGKAVVFRPREWRGVDGSTPFLATPASLAAEIGGYPRGTITWVYMTSDGGLTLQNSFLPLTGLLPPYVQLVSTDTAAALAVAASGS